MKYGFINSNSKLTEVIIAGTSTKNKMLEYIMRNIEGIIKNELMLLNSNDIKVLNDTLNNNNVLTKKSKNISLTLLMNVGHSPLIHIYYNKKSDIITINIQKDIAIIISKILNDVSFKKEHKDIIDFEESINLLLEV